MDILKNTQFLKLWGNQLVLQIAFNICNFTALLLLNKLTDSRVSQGLFYVAMTLPAFLVGLFAGAVVDISNRKKLMLITDGLLALLFLSYFLFPDSPQIILLIAFLSSSVAQFFTPAEAATIPSLVSQKDLEKANSLFLFTALGSVMAGYALAGPIIEYFGGIDFGGAKMAFLISSILTFIGFLLRLSLKNIETLKAQTNQTQIILKAVFLVTEVLNLTRKSPKIYVPIMLLTFIEFNIGLLSILFIDFAKVYLKVPPTYISYLLVLPLILGLGFGLLILKQIKKRFSLAQIFLTSCILLSFTIFVLGLSALYLTSNELQILTAFTSLVCGILIVFIAVLSRTILQQNTPEHMLGRVFSLVTISSSAIAPIPVLVLTILTKNMDIAQVFLVLGVLLFIISIRLKREIYKI